MNTTDKLDTFGKRLRSARKEAKLTQAELAKRAGMSQGNLSDIENDHVPSSTFTAKLGTILGVSAIWLAEGRLPRRTAAASEPEHEYSVKRIPAGAIPVAPRYVPVVGTTQGGPTDRCWTDGDHPTGFGMGFVASPSRDRQAYALRVVGNSMAPRYEHGEFALVEPNREPSPGDDVVVRLTSGECMIKRLTAIRPHEVALDSINAAFDRITVSPDQVEFIHYVANRVSSGSFVPDTAPTAGS